MDSKILKTAINTTMPFGKYAGRPLLLLPEPYLVWFKQKGFPQGHLGTQLAMIYEVKLNGLEEMLMPLLDSKK
ncbi:MAG: DUF3820 family protein [Pseudoalteromonas sp.]|uniref:DUF3820 family protein n=1 Tax=unclassified Pseudoalteromonas TaxID=194690 RepID=UPI000C080AB6|nr:MULTISPECIES: DUF3820 family protein [unclassified Pseudoalteromonas]MDP2636430.1 DUF3820 family protein [Pseudoalteromonas sp. 1_MG-2023]PHN90866.1 hypothetical protein CSC79_04315 [Pseudoalteromonas sp. 3D05]TGE83462.1 hypothetical protein C7Y70_10680 [Pseudoalteromonas sp. KS88]